MSSMSSIQNSRETSVSTAYPQPLYVAHISSEEILRKIFNEVSNGWQLTSNRMELKNKDSTLKEPLAEYYDVAKCTKENVGALCGRGDYANHGQHDDYKRKKVLAVFDHLGHLQGVAVVTPGKEKATKIHCMVTNILNAQFNKSDQSLNGCGSALIFGITQFCSTVFKKGIYAEAVAQSILFYEKSGFKEITNLKIKEDAIAMGLYSAGVTLFLENLKKKTKEIPLEFITEDKLPPFKSQIVERSD